MKIYGKMPEVIEEVELENNSTMMCLYMLVNKPLTHMAQLPDQYLWVGDLLDEVFFDMDTNEIFEKYVYLTVKSGWVSGDHTMQRPGFHTDGFMTDDINYLWSDNNPTQFIGGCIMGVPEDHEESLEYFDSILEGTGLEPKEYPNNTLLKLNDRVIHRARPVMTPGFRNFVKITVSDHQYRLKGNTVNPMLDSGWVNDVERKVGRNCPLGESNEKRKS